MDLSDLHRFHVAPGGDPADPLTWVWVNRSDDVEVTGGGVSISGGRADEIGQVDTSSADLRVDNASGHYCTQNPLGRWYGKLARNCPARWGTISGAATWSAAATNGWGTPDIGSSWTLGGTLSNYSASSGMGRFVIATANVANNQILNGADARDGMATFVCSSPVIATGGPLIYGLICRYTDANDYLFFCVELSTSGSISAKIRRFTGTTITLATVEPLAFTYSVNERIKARCQWDGPNLRLKVWEEAQPEPDAWTVTATDTNCQGSQVGMRLWRFLGNSNAGSLTFAVDDLEIEAVEAIGTVPAWPVRWDPTAQHSWAPIQIAGIMRRLGQGQLALRSPMYRQISSYTRLVGYWPMEDGSDATSLTNVVSGGAAGTALGMQFGSDGPAGSAGAATFTGTSAAESKVVGVFKGASTTAGWQFSWSAKLPALPAGLTQMVAWSTNNGYFWAINMNVNVYNVRVVDPGGTIVLDSNVSFVGGFDPPNDWVTFRMKATQSGGNIVAEFAWFKQGRNSPWGTTDSFSGSVGALRSWTANGNSTMQNAQICHVFGVTTGTDNLQSFNALRAFDGYVGELAADRVKRLCGEEGVPIAVEAGASESMGKQPVLGLLDLLRQCEAADMGVLYEAGAALGYRPRAARYNRPVALALQIAPDGDIADPAPEPTDDDQRISNEWTVGRLNGSEATKSDPAHIALSGRYPQNTTVNIEGDGRLADHAGWRVHLGTWGEYRWPQITLDLTDRPDLLTAWRGRPFGSRITIAGIPGQGPIGADADLIVEGWSEDITTTSWRVTLNCSPAKPWDVGVYDDAGTRRDSTSTTLGVARDAVQTSFTFSTATSVETWSTAAGDYPLDVDIGGEQVRVTAMGSVSGSGPYTQAATVQRSINGIVKPQAAGTQISLWRPVYRGL